MRQIKRIFVHCTAGSQKQTVKDLLAEFKKKRWKYPGYHYVIMPDGKIEKLLDESQVITIQQSTSPTLEGLITKEEL